MTALRIPIFPLNTILFPGGLLPLRVFEARYMDMTRDCLKNEQPFGICLIRQGKEVGEPATPEQVGCLARIISWDMQQLGLLHLKVLGGQRFRIVSSDVGPLGLVSAEVQLFADETAVALPEDLRDCARLLESIAAQSASPLFAEPHDLGNAVWVGNRLAEILPLPNATKQQLLELTDGLARAQVLRHFLQRQGVLPE